MEGSKATYVPGLPKDVAITARGLIKNLNKVRFLLTIFIYFKLI